MAKVAASVLDADFSKQGQWLKELEKARVDRIHWDIMDNRFVPNKGVPEYRIGEARKKTGLFFESHLMVEEPETYVSDFSIMGSDLLTFHVETTDKPMKMITHIRTAEMKAGICVNNKTPVEEVFPYLVNCDLVLVMSVDAGFGGQKFNEKAIEKISALRKKIDSEELECEIEVDGGINEETGRLAVHAGADILASGSYLFRHPGGITSAVKKLKKL